MRRLIIFIFFLSQMNFSFAQDFKKQIPNSTDSTYGYTSVNPLKLKKGDLGKSLENSINFLKGLKTQDGQSLDYYARSSIQDPSYKEPKIKLSNRVTGAPITGKGGILDKYIFVTSISKDTIRVFVDVYNKGDLKVPVGLKYEAIK